MTQPLEALDADMSATGNVQELRPALDRAATAEPKPHAKVPAGRRPQLRSLLLAGAAVALLAGGGWYGWDYWTTGRFLVSTDDAYVKADNTTVAPKISGYIGEVLVADNQPVKAGQVLARIDDRDFRVALDQARADVSAAEAALASKRAQLDVQRSVITAAQATLDVDTANETFASQENKRYSDLAKTGFGSVQNAQQAQSRAASAAAVIARDTANLASAQRQLELSKAEIAQAEAAAVRAAAIARQAELNLGYTVIAAPIEGIVGNRTLRPGQFVQAGTQLMSLVPVASAYVVANFKETQLTDVRAGQRVDIAVDMFPGQRVHGHVDSLAPASGQEFALLPPDNATGNFTKVVQRIPVKIALDQGAAIELRPGMSVISTIDTRGSTGKPAEAAVRTSDASFESTR
ncbi:HlyD family secretion protein [Bradyrhizobium sp. U87765 SZCCT0131]|uniref:HlyD family secretion protein n=1 Tax=unclassified Bradyrhizobium TaxID=2631580 RepID=UPI001BAB47C0|nr:MULTISPECIES: HlyD family secretion protein [unclassified Bradyrhizobium]MBR1221610.1 HlyD family secretion protein [Bradyrhizobium sp. U87765 SZCCT0131]MBR1264467.1 HlyD family secretion protein [Bradyrhizobium sp. U87765 SZCCT0134]MBR1304626.1 HlyD family secretion protein [Bradyrhizobium sp. U87765 SZCCT0110]MBR1322517.1 HlyD family secretion protein [Bradyrhizobium sp. U87765 SZCCT0109]MBR1346555.1 HlyD family secretion protein [Bradyrhizobium sp. U87765 SZCCT0048]